MAMTKDQAAEYHLLQLATLEGKIAIEVGIQLAQTPQYALERLQLRGWLTLIDISGISTNPDARLMRIFLASPEAMAWVLEMQRVAP